MNFLSSTALNMFMFLCDISLFLLAFSLFFPCLSLTVCVCQRWVSEKLSVESLRDLELFGGEVQGKPRCNKRFLKHCLHIRHQHKQKTTSCHSFALSKSLLCSASQMSSLNHKQENFSQSAICYLSQVCAILFNASCLCVNLVCKNCCIFVFGCQIFSFAIIPKFELYLNLSYPSCGNVVW